MHHNDVSRDKKLILDVGQRVVSERLRLLCNRINEPRPGSKFNVFKLLRDKISTIQDRPKGIYIYGAVGRGKTKLMNEFFEKVLIPQKRRVHHHHFMAELHTNINRKIVRGEETGGDDALIRFAKQQALNMHLLCFDDFQVTDIGDAMVLGPLFKTLIEAGVVIVITSNRDPDSLYKNGINRERFVPFIELIKDRLKIIKLDGDLDYRTKFITSSEVYYTPLNAMVIERLENIFHKLSDGITSRDNAFVVKGRTIELDRVAQGVAMTSFESLCAKNLSVNDYITLQTFFHTLIMCNIPQLDSDRLNEAKRFVGLIDVLYEHRVNFICSAEVQPEKLYRRGHGSFEFSRTVSRLKEMQSKEYISEAHRP